MQINTSNLRKGKWVEWEVDYLIENYNYKSNNDIGLHIERSKDAVAAKLHSLGLTRTNEKYISEIRNNQDSSIQRRALFAEWDKMFSPPQKEPCNKFAQNLYLKFKKRENEAFNNL